MPLSREISIYFPYNSLRLGQEEVINKINQTVKNQSHLILEASNGFGKTISSLVAILPFIKENDLKIVYLCRTHSQNQRVIGELKEISKKLGSDGESIKIGALGLRGRAAMCFHPYVLENNPDSGTIQLICRQMRRMKRCKLYLNMEKNPGNVQDLLNEITRFPMDGSDLIQICKVWELCPYVISKQALSTGALDVIACNFQWMVNPFIRDIFLENLQTTLDKIILIVDEAHNLPRVSTDVASSTLTQFANRLMIKEAKELDLSEFEDFGSVVDDIFAIFQKKKSEEMDVSPDLIIKKFKEIGIEDLQRFFLSMISEGEEYRNHLLSQNKFPRSYLYSSGSFWLTFLEKLTNDSYYYCMSKVETNTGDHSLKLEIISLDPSDLIRPLLDQVHSSIHMSGTINLKAYRDIIKFPDNTTICSMSSPFTREQSIVLCVRNVSTKNDARTPEMYKSLVTCCDEAIRAIPKNVGIFCASYEVLNNLLKQGLKDKIKKSGKKLFSERMNMTSKENDEMFIRYKRETERKGAVLLGVCGGRNAEGQDFPGDLMNGSIIVGVPFARPTKKIRAGINYFSKYWGENRGKELGYFVDAFQRASQAAGRPIRKLDDKGSIIFLDQRFASRYFKRFLSSWLREKMQLIDNQNGNIEAHLKAFWEK
ncbi:MAG: helicase C-terminal domain-containing protein [Candidatus Helarchaeota archaeon]